MDEDFQYPDTQVNPAQQARDFLNTFVIWRRGLCVDTASLGEFKNIQTRSTVIAER
jgi:hypothetical protein